jgi:hypothetical protein
MIYTYSKFHYGMEITQENRFGNINEGAGELTASIAISDYTLGESIGALQAALNNAGLLVYTVSLNRATNQVTISATGVFSLLLSTGSSVGLSFWELFGFTQTSDLTGQTSYTGASPAGFEYYPQFLLQSYISPTIYKQSAEATVNKSASGRVEIVRFGVEQFIEMDIKFITNKVMDGSLIKNSATGLEDAIEFLDYATGKRKMEFFEDESSTTEFYKVLLESTPGYTNGTGYKLRELFSQNLPDIYETGIIRFRVV